ncbi:MAG: GNAT family N-acetyltransferase [Sulfitobacter sp.]|uniref:GNAT family N-acetyltransferase n=1 Tax=Celeribacter marinus TaxID=1397108 RepID=UPI00317A8840
MTSENRKKYRDLCDQESGFTLFQQAWWLDAVAEDNWDVLFVENAGEILGANAFLRDSKLHYTLSQMPRLTQHIGPWISPKVEPDGFRNDILRSIAKEVRSIDWWSQNWSTAETNWLPFYWEGFRQTTRYTHRINDVSDLKQLWSQMSGSKRKAIQKARSEKFGLSFDVNPQVDEFLELAWGTFTRQGMVPPYSRDFVRRIVNAASERNRLRILIARDKNGEAHAGAFFVWDGETMYYLIGGSNPMHRASQAGSLCIWEGIRLASELGLSFDFEGSMIEPIEKYFRGFGTQRVPYFAISRVGPLTLSLIAWLRQRRQDANRMI